MTTYARLTQDGTALEAILELTALQYAALAAWKRSFLRLYVIDAQPEPSTTQKVVPGAPSIGVAEYHVTWQLVAKSQAELDRDDQTTELALLRTLLGALQADIDAGITAAPTTAAQAFVEIQDLKRRALRADRVLKWLVKQQ